MLIESVGSLGGDKNILITSYSNRAIPKKVVCAQDNVMKSILRGHPRHCYHWFPLRSRSRAMHYQWIDAVLCDALRKFDAVILLDVDCVPYSSDSLDILFEQANQPKKIGSVVGVEQISPEHKTNHYYASPVASCITREVFDLIGTPSAIQNLDGDVMESFTYAAERCGIPVKLLRVINVLGPKLWKFPDGRDFGIGTVYGQNGRKLFFHNFCSSTKPSSFLGVDHTEYFVNECQVIVNSLNL